MNVNAKQVNGIDIHNRMDNTSVLGFFMQIKDIYDVNTALTTAMAGVWTAFTGALNAFDVAYAQTRKWMQTEEIDNLDKSRDSAVRAFMNAMKAMLASPNDTKAAAAKRIKFVRDKYEVNAEDEYMKETTAISQMVQDMEANCTADLATTGLDEWFADMKAKNEAFLDKMNERTEEQAGQQKGIVRETRNQAEAAYRDLMKLLNAMSICEYPSGIDFGNTIDHLNAEIEHYRQILARKGVSTGSGSSGSGGASPDPSQGGGNEGGDTGNSGNSGDSGGSTGGNEGGGSTGGDSGGGDDNGDDNNGPIGDAE